ncbi:MAG: membrane dipeptidase [Pseudomonadota bacterium]
MIRWLTPLLCALVLVAACAPVGRLSEKIGKNRLFRPEVVTCFKGSEPCLDPSELWIADLHADTLLWQRDLRKKIPRDSTIGHVTTQRLIEGGIGLQVFAVPTQTPIPTFLEGGDQCASKSSLDTQKLLKIQELFPDPRVFYETRPRALQHIRRYKHWIADDRAKLSWIQTTTGLDSVPEGKVGALLALEGLHWVKGTKEEISEQINELADEGVQMASLTHRFTNALGNSSEDCHLEADEQPLTKAGEVAINAMVARGIIFDFAHASAGLITAASKLLIEHERAQRSVDGAGPERAIRSVMSHGGVHRVCPYKRNLRPESVRDIVKAGGIIAIGYWTEALCLPDDAGPDDVFLNFTLSQVAIFQALSDSDFREEYESIWCSEGKTCPDFDPFDHIALGSDFDGAVRMVLDTSDVPAILASLAAITCDDLKKARNFASNALADVTSNAREELIEFCKKAGRSGGEILPFDTEQITKIAGGNVRKLLLQVLPRT